jgi:hypothetical protein
VKLGSLYRYEVYTAEKATQARALKKQKGNALQAGRMQGLEEGTKEAFKQMSADAVGVLHLAMQKLADEAVLKDENGDPTGALDTANININTLRQAMSAANSILDRSEGKATTRIEGKVEHEHTFWQEIASKGLLEG